MLSWLCNSKRTVNKTDRRNAGICLVWWLKISYNRNIYSIFTEIYNNYNNSEKKPFFILPFRMINIAFDDHIILFKVCICTGSYA